ncbi:TPA_asm: P6 [Ocimum alphacytorhabdovirus 1]|nr:TPA_asm: P6 [Ocimum alphacytorhabdovirus 1]
MNIPGEDSLFSDYSVDFPNLTEDVYQMIIFGLMLVKLILIIIIVSLRNKNKRLHASMKWK